MSDIEQEKEQELDNNITEELERQVTEDFKNMVIDWVKKDDEIRELSKDLKELKDERKNLEELILEYMSKINVDMFEIGDGKLRKNVSKTKCALKHNIIQDSLVQIFHDVQKAHKTTQFILDNRPIKERVRLKRTYNRKKK